MAKILILTVTAMKEKLFIAFMMFVYNALGMFDVIEELFGYYANQVKEAYENLNRVFLKYDIKFNTEKVQEYDTKRIDDYRNLRAKVRYNATYAEDETKKEAASILLKVIELYGDPTKMKVQERTTVLSNLVEDFEEKYPTQAEALGIGTLLAALKQNQQLYIEAYMARTEVVSEEGLRRMELARTQMTEAYRDLVTAVNLAAKRDEEGRLTPFIDFLNVEIRRNFIHTGQSVSNTVTDSEGTAPAVNYKFATFKYIGGNEMKFKIEVGTPLVAQTNTEGYRWEPEVPALMPKRSITFREVAIDPEEGEAIFHFLDHHEEILRQHVGTELVAPLNTENCIWVPTPPELMPAGQTNYAEELAQQILNPAENITIKFRGTDNQILHEMVVPVDYQIPESEFPTPPEGTHWNFTLADLNLAIGMKNPGDTITVRAQA